MPVTFGVLTDLSGFVAAQLAGEAFKAESPGAQVWVLSADHQNKPDIGAAIR